MHPRTTAAIVAGKAAARASRALGRGGGTAIAGLVAERIDPGIIHTLARQAAHGVIAVTGTNGKTTTSLMLSRIARESGLRPLHNRSGSNLMRGVAAALVQAATTAGALPDAHNTLAVLEVDEATLPHIVPAAQPRAIVFTNLFRDQLDRYGEVDTVAQAWQRALAQAAPDTTLVLNADDPAVAHLGDELPSGVHALYYGIDDATAAGDAKQHASDFRTCLRCGAEIRYTATFYGHIGHWRCDSCGNRRPSPDVRITQVTPDGDSMRLAIDVPAPAAGAPDALCVTLPLAGLYNAYNALAAAAGAAALGLEHAAIVRALDGFSAAFGRQERFQIAGRDVQVLLGKNPTGLNQILRAIAARPGRKRLLFFLNDGIADGRDVSWIWDTDYELAQPQADYVLAAGTRAEDLALRLKYAGFGDDVPIQRDERAAVLRAVRETPPGETLYVVPTYTAMLRVRELLARKSGRAAHWEDA
jgi:UDP-N-acetylmuramyl tripeptide synthase